MKKRLAAILAPHHGIRVQYHVLSLLTRSQLQLMGEKVNFEDQQPVNIDGRIMVPIWDVAEKWGWEAEWFTYYGDTGL